MSQGAGAGVLEKEPAEQESDPYLISLARAGASAAFGKLYERHVGAARRLALVLAHNPSDADDLVAETFTRVLAAMRAGRGPDSAFRAYLLTTLRHTLYDRARRERRVEYTDDLTPYERLSSTDDPVVKQLESSYAAKAFARLPERWRAVLWHIEVEGETPAQVAPLLGLTPNGVRALAYRARERLRQMYLREHIDVTPSPRCQWTGDHLAAYVRAQLARHDRSKVESHLAECRGCRALHRELTEENSGLRGVLAALILGTAASAYLISAGTPVGFARRLAAIRAAAALLWHHTVELATIAVATVSGILPRLRHLAGLGHLARLRNLPGLGHLAGNLARLGHLARRLRLPSCWLIERFGPGNVAAAGLLVAASTAGIAAFALVLVSGSGPLPPGPPRPAPHQAPAIAAPTAAPLTAAPPASGAQPHTDAAPAAPTPADASSTGASSTGGSSTDTAPAAPAPAAPGPGDAAPPAPAPTINAPQASAPRSPSPNSPPPAQPSEPGRTHAAAPPVAAAAANLTVVHDPSQSWLTAGETGILPIRVRAAGPIIGSEILIRVRFPAGMRLAAEDAGAGWTCRHGEPVTCTGLPSGRESVLRLPVRVDPDVTGFQTVIAVVGTRGTALRVPVAPAGMRVGYAALGNVGFALGGNALRDCGPRPACLARDNGRQEAAGGAGIPVPAGAHVRWAGLAVKGPERVAPTSALVWGPGLNPYKVEVFEENLMGQGFADITELVRRAGGGDWWVAVPGDRAPADMQADAGWSIAVVYDLPTITNQEVAVYVGPRRLAEAQEVSVGVGGRGSDRSVDVALVVWESDRTLREDSVTLDRPQAGDVTDAHHDRNPSGARCVLSPGECPRSTPGPDVLRHKAVTAGDLATLRSGHDPMTIGLFIVQADG